MADVSKYEPLDAATEPVAGKADPLFVKHFGSDFEALERELQAYLTSKSMKAEYVDPIENQTHYIMKSVEKVGLHSRLKWWSRRRPQQRRNGRKRRKPPTKKPRFSR